VNTSTVGAGGTNRIDNILVTGNAIPAPGAVALLGVAGLVGARRRR
jgi:MYXO-CTERM domain-containing protein